ncbi:CB1 cannabinoid receptor-interacting protein 1-like isoform X1 [Dermatophagoides pteronyssinus]|uniref:CB1 cannabinoid receptor-interacting protein 1-like isoform X1 n=1 Tax=Dermatophagoides pteronyssinus TaxID=6956 RepID=UPI003F663A29
MSEIGNPCYKMASKTYFACIEINRMKKDGTTIDENAPKICFKRDGQRFDEEFTLKLPVETNYEFLIQIRPPMPVRSVTIRMIDGDETGVKIVDQSSSEDGAMYSFQWDTNNCIPDKKRKRSKLQINILFQDNMKLEIPLQIKFYKADDHNHLQWGQPLKHINFECEQKSGMNCSTIIKKCYL